MGTVQLEGGKTLTVDTSKMTVKEWRAFVNPKGTVEDENALVTKCTGLTVDEIEALPYRIMKEIVKAIVLDARDPLSSPN